MLYPITPVLCRAVTASQCSSMQCTNPSSAKMVATCKDILWWVLGTCSTVLKCVFLYDHCIFFLLIILFLDMEYWNPNLSLCSIS